MCLTRPVIIYMRDVRVCIDCGIGPAKLFTLKLLQLTFGKA